MRSILHYNRLSFDNAFMVIGLSEKMVQLVQMVRQESGRGEESIHPVFFSIFFPLLCCCCCCCCCFTVLSLFC